MSDQSEHIRAFVCINLEPALIGELRELEQRLESAVPKRSVRWTSPEQIHLTLKFLGHVAVTERQHVQVALQHTCRGERPFQLRAEGVGAFPDTRHPGVIWVGVIGDLEPLVTLQKQIDSAVQPWCETEENRAFRPHLTLGRVRVARSRACRQIGRCIQTTEFASAHPWRVEQIFLMQSELLPRGAVHTVIASAPFSDSAAPTMM
jgi:2'-5' RNA ligase